jgi:hypothetical protein
MSATGCYRSGHVRLKPVLWLRAFGDAAWADSTVWTWFGGEARTCGETVDPEVCPPPIPTLSAGGGVMLVVLLMRSAPPRRRPKARLGADSAVPDETTQGAGCLTAVWIWLTDRLYGMYSGSMGASVRKRTYNLDGDMIEKVRRLYNAKTDTEAIQKALRKAIDDREIEEALDALLRAGRFRTVYR